MSSASHLRAQIEAALGERIPSALYPRPRLSRPVEPTGNAEIDLLLQGGFPLGAISEVVGEECSGRTSLALTFVAGMTQAGKVCAWVDVCDTLHPESAAALGVDLARLLWIRCGVPTLADDSPQHLAEKMRPADKPPKIKHNLPPDIGGHPRMEAKGLSNAVSDLLGTAPRCAEPVHKSRPQPRTYTPIPPPQPAGMQRRPRVKSWARLEQALRVSDLLLQAGGFSCIVLDMGSLNAEYALRVPLATWFRFRAAAERLQSNVLLLTQHPCTRNSAEVVLRLETGRLLAPDSTVFSGLEHRAEVARQRFTEAQGNVLPLRKPPQSVQTAHWQNKTAWAGRR